MAFALQGNGVALLPAALSAENLTGRVISNGTR
jgi:hypothetical protein